MFVPIRPGLQVKIILLVGVVKSLRQLLAKTQYSFQLVVMWWFILSQIFF